MSKDKGTPEHGKQYRLVGGTGTKSIASGNTWAESEVKDDHTTTRPHEKQTYKAWFKIYNEPKWCTATKEWDTEDEATSHALGKFMAWTATEDWCVKPTGVDPNN